ncbi:MAG TPA: isoprenylcysteine carboxylmethyltransferase family protein [Pirellulales bacterium]|nr:isoprenylcysteine carboxylmethyltransferase family protein [Pirellulales bacterium]
MPVLDRSHVDSLPLAIDDRHRDLPKGLAFRLRGAVGAAVVIAGASIVFWSFDPVPRSGSWSDIALDAMAWAMFLAGAIIRFWATLYIGGRKGRSLVTVGPYSLCRHPLYVGTFLIALSVAPFAHSVTFGVLVALGIAYYAYGTVAAEETSLRQIWGERFDAYCRDVPAFWPRLRNWRSPTSIEVNLQALAREARRASRWAWLPIAADIIAHVQLHPWCPAILHLP